MTSKYLKQLLLLVLSLFLSGCAGLSLKATPIPESPQVKMLLSSNGDQLKADDQGLYPFNHTWNSGYCAAEPETSVFINPVDTSRVDSATLSQSHLGPKDLSELAEYARKRLAGAFSAKKGNFRVVEERPTTGRVVELSVVELTGTEVARNVLGTALSTFIPGGGLIAMRSSGTIGVEGVVKEAHTGKPLLVFADRERGKTAPFSFNDFRRLSHARAAIDDWSKELVAACAAAPGTKVRGSSSITLSPI